MKSFYDFYDLILILLIKSIYLLVVYKYDIGHKK